MKSKQYLLVGLFAGFALIALVGNLAAETISVADPNLLSGKSAAASTVNVGFSPAYVMDGKAVVDGGVNADWVSLGTSPYDSSPRLAIWGFDNSYTITHIRIWGAGDLDPAQCAIKSSTSLITPTTGSFPANQGDSYETTLVALSAMPTRMTDGTAGDLPWQMYYWDFEVSAPEGTQSLFFQFVRASGKTRVRICEVQAYGEVPEPGTLMLLSTSLIGLLAYAWRKRK
ncbi:MAG: PEP-CTERM sorting domain-containing protein [Pirellulales bacterium]|nr:PEP-CTERM sorting domain-containing protein [Pirellulales bacterium]